MGIVEINQETPYDVITIITTLQQLLETSQNDNHKLKQSLSDQQHQYQKYLDSKTDGILQENNMLCIKQDKLETDLYTKGQALDEEKKATQYWKRLYDDLEKSFYIEREEFDNDRQLWIHRESQLADHIRLLKQQQHQREQKQHYIQSVNQKDTLLLSGTQSMKNNYIDGIKATTFSSSQLLDGTDTNYQEDQTSHQDSIDSTWITESPNNTINQQDTILSLENRIIELKSDHEQQAIKLQQQHSLDRHEATQQINYLMDQISNIKQLNQSLMEENEGYRMLLHEKTISGDFTTNSIGKFVESDQSTDIDYNKNQRRLSQDTDKNDTTNDQTNERQTLNLADELALAASSTEKNIKENDLLTEIKTLQDENSTLQRYMNKILLRIIENKHTENLLSIDEPNNKQRTTIIKSTTTKRSMDPRKTMSCLSFETAATTTLDHAVISDSTKRDDGGDSWSYIFKRMGGGLGSWARTNHSGTNYMVDNSLSIQVEKPLA